MGTLVTQTVQSSVSGAPVFKDNSGTEVGQLAKAWVNFDGTSGGTTKTIRSSFNVSTITDNGVGDYTVTFTNAMPNANYVVHGCGGLGQNSSGAYTAWTSIYIHSKSGANDGTNVWKSDPTTTSFRIAISRMGDGNYMIDYERVSLSVFGG